MDLIRVMGEDIMWIIVFSVVGLVLSLVVVVVLGGYLFFMGVDNVEFSEVRKKIIFFMRFKNM